MPLPAPHAAQHAAVKLWDVNPPPLPAIFGTLQTIPQQLLLTSQCQHQFIETQAHRLGIRIGKGRVQRRHGIAQIARAIDRRLHLHTRHLTGRALQAGAILPRRMPKVKCTFAPSQFTLACAASPGLLRSAPY